MPAILFWIFSGLMLLFAAMVVILRQPVSSAFSLVVSFLALAALYVSLDAFFIGVIQIMVYAGAVMVLFLFIIMLLDLKAEVRRNFKLPATFAALAVVLIFGLMVRGVVSSFEMGEAPLPALVHTDKSDIWHVGETLFTTFNLPFQVIGVLILVATVGVVVLSKRELK
ncbi:MAG: NADH-quinone oxidoreductase subunit J [Chthoniobacterales bacterium]